MSARTRTAATVAILVIVTVAVAVYRLGEVPADLSRVELDIAAEARAVAATGRGTTGELLPLFFSTADYPPGREPLNIYATAILLRVLPFSRMTVRLASGLVAALDVALMYLVARRIFRRELIAVAAAALLAISPAHVIYSRTAINALYPIPFVMFWLWCMARLVEDRQSHVALLAGLSLGVGLYSHPSALVTMPVLLAATLAVVLWDRRRWDWRATLAVAGFAIPLTLWLLWSTQHFDRVAALANHYKLYDASRLNVLQGMRDLTSYFGLSVRSYIYWQYFSPSILFFAGEPVLLNSVRHIGALPLPVCLLIAVGLFRVIAQRGALELSILVLLVCSALGAALEPSLTIRRALVVLPSAVLLAAFGLQYCLERPKLRYVAGTLVALSLLQFQAFFSRYLIDPAMQR